MSIPVILATPDEVDYNVRMALGHSPWFEDEDFWLHFAPVMFSADRWARSREEMEKAAEILGLEPGDRVLDACCGVGRHAVELHDLGFEVTGVDRLQSYLDAARETAAEAAEKDGCSDGGIEFVLEDVRHFTRPDYFDGAVNMFTSLGYFERLDDELVFLKNVWESLKPGGSFLVDVMGKEVLAKHFKPAEWYEADCGLVLAEYTILDGWTHLHNRWIVVTDEGRYEYSFAHRVFSGAELSDLLERAGFDTVEVYGSLDRIPYDQDAVRLVAVGRKKQK